MLAQPDAFTAYDPPEASDAAWRSPQSGTTSQADLLAEAAAAGAVEPGGRLLTDVNPSTRAGARTLLAPLLAGAGVVWVRHPDESGWDRRADQERATDRLRRP